jgi:hypothetical protein
VGGDVFLEWWLMRIIRRRLRAQLVRSKDGERTKEERGMDCGVYSRPFGKPATAGKLRASSSTPLRCAQDDLSQIAAAISPK